MLRLDPTQFRAATQTIETEENLTLMRLIDEEYMRHPFLARQP